MPYVGAEKVGPRSLLELQSFMHDILFEMQSDGLLPSDFIFEEMRLVVSSTYCCVGTMHIALNYFIAAFEDVFGIQIQYRTFSMCDNADECVPFLECFGPKH